MSSCEYGAAQQQRMRSSLVPLLCGELSFVVNGSVRLTDRTSMRPYSAAASASATRSCWSRSSAVKNGSAIVRELRSSDTGHIPSRNP